LHRASGFAAMEAAFNGLCPREDPGLSKKQLQELQLVDHVPTVAPGTLERE
jgi:hypothetical protein